ncbi:MAG: alpha/beta hydrolase [Acidobacteria bacterium]|nr:MAG: alpha/beta hydrolase [Acidobacteriota bacterium]
MRRRLSGARRVHGPVRGASPAGNDLVKRTSPMIACVALLACGFGAAALAQQSASARKSAAATHPAPLEGDWSGVLQVGETQLHLVLHLSKDTHGEWHAAVDSLDQAVYGMEASKVTRSEDTLRFELTSVGAQFQGKILPDRKMIRGLWEQGGTGLPLRFEKRAAGAEERLTAGSVSKVEGTWQGAIETGNMRMRLQLHLSHDEKGQLTAAVDSLDQGIQGIPASHVTEQAGQVKFELPAFGAEYNGALNAAKNEIAGHWSQNGNLETLDFRRSDKILELRRPQNPAKPYPYKEEEVSFAAGDGKLALAATLTLPQGAGPFPAALLVGGSGPNDRDETIAGHKPFLVLADFLTKRGIAVLRYDKRGIAKSTGNYADATMENFTQDAQAAFGYLKSRKEVDVKRLGIIGHSEGGILGALVATRSNDLNWMVLLATPATTGERTLLRQSELIARAGGLAEEQITRSLEFDRKAYRAVREEKDAAALERRLRTLVEQSGLGAAMPPAALQAQIRMMSSPWFREFLDYDPAPALEKLKCPVLALSGDRDLQVDSTENVPLLRKAYESSGNKDFMLVEIEGVNHLFQKAQSGSPALYGAIEETIAPEILTAVGNWVSKHTTQ